MTMRYPGILAGLVTSAICIGVFAHASLLPNRVPISVDTSGRGLPATTYANSQCKQQCDMQAGQCNLACSQGPNALQCSQQCTNEWQRCTSSCN
jgi:hypothetical protein